MQTTETPKKWRQRMPGWAFALIPLSVVLGAALTVLAAVLFGDRLVEMVTPRLPTPAVVYVTPLPAPGPSIHISPAEGGPGTPITVAGRGWKPGDTVSVYLDNPRDSQSPRASFMETTVVESGGFSVELAFPATLPWIGLPAALVVAESANAGVRIWEGFRVLPAAQTATPIPTPISWPTLVPAAVATPTPTQPAFTPTPTETPVVPPTPTPVPTITAWRGEYYAGSGPAGDPIAVRNDVAIDFDWGLDPPAAGLPADEFSARWTRRLAFDEGTYRFHTVADDGVRLYVDGELVIDAWRDGARRERIAEHALAAGEHNLRVEYYEQTGAALVRVWWEKVAVYPDWRGEYWANAALAGAPALVRNDAGIDFEWDLYAPIGLPEDGFSARWTRVLPFDGGVYRFYALVDDGLRLYVDDQLVIDEWHDGGRRELSGDYRLAAGDHRLRVEYYERSGGATAYLWWEKVAVDADWRAEYWPNPGLEGEPTLARSDPAVSFAWEQGSPDPSLPADGFSARWTREIHFDEGTYRFRATVDDGVRVWVDGENVLYDWRDSPLREVRGEIALTRGVHTVQVEYYERIGDARIRLWWETVPSSAFRNWRAEYWPNRELNGSPALVRNDRVIFFDWGVDAPAAGLPGHDFSVRWSRWALFEPGLYRFYARADDGIRFYLDGKLLMDEWHDGQGDRVYTVDRTLSGAHWLVVEYYEHEGVAAVQFWWARIEAP